MSSPVFVHDADAAWVEAGPGVRRKILTWNADLMLVRVEFEDGAIGPPHSHPHVQSCFVESGAFEITIEGETRVLRAGDSFIVPSNALHGARALAGGTLIDVFTPHREDFVDPARS